MTESLAIWPTTKDIFAYVRKERKLALRYAAAPVLLLILLDVAGTLAGIDIDKNWWWQFLTSVASLVIPAPLIVTWYQALIRGETQAVVRPVMTFTRLEGAVIALNVQIAAVFTGTFAVLVVAVALPCVLVYRVNETVGKIVGVLLTVPAGFLLTLVLTRLTMALAFAAAGESIGLRGAWTVTKGIGMRLTWIHILIIGASGIPGLAVYVAVDQIAHALAMSPAAEALMASGIGTFFAVVYLLFTTTLFGLVYRALAPRPQGGSAVAASQPA